MNVSEHKNQQSVIKEAGHPLKPKPLVASKRDEKPKRMRSASGSMVPKQVKSTMAQHSKNTSVAVNTTGATQMTTQAMSPKNAAKKNKNGSVKTKKGEKQGINVVEGKENLPGLTLKDLEIQVRSGVNRPQTAASTSRRVKSGKRESIDRELKEQQQLLHSFLTNLQTPKTVLAS